MRFPKTTRLADKSHYAEPGLSFHLTIAAHPDVSAFAPAVADAIWKSVLERRTATRIELHAACLMTDHLHLLASPREQDIISFVRNWKSWTSWLARDAGHFGPIWQPGMWDRTCRDERDYEETITYIIRNPVAAKLVESEEDWPHSWCEWWNKPLESRGSAPA
ncbi:MAG: transposase [Tepidiformaceae bacterium]